LDQSNKTKEANQESHKAQVWLQLAKCKHKLERWCSRAKNREKLRKAKIKQVEEFSNKIWQANK